MTAPKEWTEASWPGRVVALEQQETTGEALVALHVGLAGRIVLALPADHIPPQLGEQLTVTLHRGAQI